MKKIYLLMLFSGFFTIVKSQAILEHVYPDQTIYGPYKLTNGGWVYATIHWGQPKNDVKVYSSDHNLLKTIPMEIPSGGAFNAFYNLSDNLFNLDDKIEILYGYTQTIQPYFEISLQNEDGTILQDFPNFYNLFIYDINGAFKMRTFEVYNDSNNYVYSLPGSMVQLPEKYSFENGLKAFPNPCKDNILIPYTEGSICLKVRM